MKRFKIEHIHCKAIRFIYGVDYWDACRKGGYDPVLWRKLSEEYYQ